MKFKAIHNNYNVLNLEKSLSFYKESLNLDEVKRKVAEDESFILVYLGNDQSDHLIELTWLKNRTTPYNLGDNEIHLAFCVDDYEKAYQHHKDMNVICYENIEMGLYFISDPDGYWIEIVPCR